MRFPPCQEKEGKNARTEGLHLMHPVLFQLGPLALRWYGVMMGLALFLSVPITAHFGERFGIPRTLIIDRLAVPFLASLLVGARIGYVVSHPAEFAGDPLAAVRPPYAGLASHGSIAAGLLFLWWWCRRHAVSLWRLADAMTPGVILAWTLGRARHQPRDGALFWSAMMMSSVLRFALDLLRSQDRTAVSLTLGQMAALVLLGWGAWFLWIDPRAGAHRRP